MGTLSSQSASPEFVEKEMDLLFSIPGVSAVERDTEMHIMDMPSHRGRSAEDQMNGILESVAIGQVNIFSSSHDILPLAQRYSIHCRLSHIGHPHNVFLD